MLLEQTTAMLIDCKPIILAEKIWLVQNLMSDENPEQLRNEEQEVSRLSWTHDDRITITGVNGYFQKTRRMWKDPRLKNKKGKFEGTLEKLTESWEINKDSTSKVNCELGYVVMFLRGQKLKTITERETHTRELFTYFLI